MRKLTIYFFTFLLLFLSQSDPNHLLWADKTPETINKPLIVGGDDDFPPYDFLDDEGNPTGYCVDLVQAIADTMGFEVVIELGNWSEMRAKLERGEIDLLLGMMTSKDRDTHLDFSPPHSIVHHSIFVREQQSHLNTLEQLADQELIVIKDDIMHEFAIENQLTAKLIVAQDQYQALQLLASGQHDAALIAYLPAMYQITKHGWNQLKPVGSPLSPYRYCFAVQDGDLETLSKFTEGLAILKENGEYQAIYNRWLGIYAKQNKWIYYLQYIFLVLVLGILLVIIWAWQLKRMVNRQTMKLKASEERFRRLAEHVPDIIFRKILPEGRYDYVSPAVNQILGYSQEEFYENPGFIKSLIYPDDQALVNQHLQLKTQGEYASDYEYRVINRNGETRWVHQRDVCFPDALSDTIVVEGIITDITSLKEKERESLALEKKILQAQKYKSLGILAGGVAHDFNNLLMTILGNADLALQELPKYSTATEYLESIITASRRAADLCHQMLAYSGKGQFVIRAIQLNDLVEEIVEILRMSISKKIVVRVNSHGSPPVIEGDRSQIQQIVINLVTNASEAIGDDSGVISIFTGTSECSEAYLNGIHLAENLSEGVYAYLEVTDTGCGMSKDVVGKVFDPFFSTKFAGRGLGMPAVLGIVRGHHGAIKIYSEPNRGTTIRCLFPVSEQAQPKPESLKDLSQEDLKPLEGFILLVDDEESIRLIGKEMLSLLGYSVITASDGREALEIYRAQQDKIVFVILDLTMPTMDGEECFRELRQMNPEVKVVFSSGFSEQEIEDKFAARGYLNFIQKPYTMEHLKEKIIEIKNHLL